jgi:hypothetical protein
VIGYQAMGRLAAIAALSLVSCGDDVHELGACGASWDADRLGSETRCEAACVEKPIEAGSRCEASHPDIDHTVECSATFERGGYRGCCEKFFFDGTRTEVWFLACI